MIETPRLIIRPYTLDDFQPYYAMLSDPAVYERLESGPLFEENSWSRMLFLIGHWHCFGYSIFAVCDRLTGEYVGETGLAVRRRGLGPDLDYDEAAWTFIHAVHGKGMALEAAKAIHDWHEAKYQRRRTVCMISPGNRPSIRLAEKLGYRPYGQGSFHGTAITKFERTL